MSIFSDFHVYSGSDAASAPPKVRSIRPRDCFAALSEGFDDFLAMPSHLVFLGLFYVLAGLVLSSLSSFGGALQLLFPLASGFALVGPVVAIGLYEMSRRRELGRSPDWRDAFVVVRSPALPAIIALGLLLMAIFAAWIGSAEALYVWLYGPNPPASAGAFLNDVLGSSRGWLLIGIGGAVGFCFAALTLCLSIVSFPLLLDRDVGLVVAIGASLRTAWMNPAAVALWGLIVAGGLALGSLPLFVGLAIVMPVLGHATWRLYRRTIVRDPDHEHHAQWPSELLRRPDSFYSSPHSVLFPWPSAAEKDAKGPGGSATTK
jgi:uncharacterized membrane protein